MDKRCFTRTRRSKVGPRPQDFGFFGVRQGEAFVASKASQRMLRPYL